MNNKVTILSPTHKNVEYKYLMNDKQLEVYNHLTDNGKNMSLSIFSQLSQNGLLNKRYVENINKIKLS